MNRYSWCIEMSEDKHNYHLLKFLNRYSWCIEILVCPYSIIRLLSLNRYSWCIEISFKVLIVYFCCLEPIQTVGVLKCSSRIGTRTRRSLEPIQLVYWNHGNEGFYACTTMLEPIQLVYWNCPLDFWQLLLSLLNRYSWCIEIFNVILQIVFERLLNRYSWCIEIIAYLSRVWLYPLLNRYSWCIEIKTSLISLQFF